MISLFSATSNEINIYSIFRDDSMVVCFVRREHCKRWGLKAGPGFSLK